VQAFEQIDAWIEGGAVLIGEARDHLDRLRQLVIDGRVVDGRVHDAKIAAICLSHGISELWTADRDFSRFPALKTRNPLVATS
jgi:predicted nucleic acid-binding protein